MKLSKIQIYIKPGYENVNLSWYELKRVIEKKCCQQISCYLEITEINFGEGGEKTVKIKLCLLHKNVIIFIMIYNLFTVG